MTCNRCKEKGKHSSQCAFDEDGYFKSDNWACDTMLSLRKKAIESGLVVTNSNSTVLLGNQKVEQKSYAMIPHPVLGVGIISWWKNQSRTTMFQMCFGEDLKEGKLYFAQELLGDKDPNFMEWW